MLYSETPGKGALKGFAQEWLTYELKFCLLSLGHHAKSVVIEGNIRNCVLLFLIGIIEGIMESKEAFK